MSASLAPTTAPALHEQRATRACVRPGCGRHASTTMRFDYAERAVTLDPLGPDTEPGKYDLCLRHAARSTPPTGWTLRDRAPSPAPATEPAPPVGPDRGPGVDRLAAALSAVPRVVSEDAPDAAPGGTDRAVAPAASAASAAPKGASRLDGLLRPSTPAVTVRPVPLSERTPEAAVRPVPQPLRLAPDPTTTVWCADLLAAPDEPSPAPLREPSAGPSGDREVPTLFA